MVFYKERPQKDAKICLNPLHTPKEPWNMRGGVTPKEHWNMRGGCFGVSVSKAALPKLPPPLEV